MIQISKPYIGYGERRNLNFAMAKSDVGLGEYVGKFEEAWAKYNKKSFGVACNSGTNAIYLALKALGIGKGDFVIVPEFTMVATAWAVTYTGAVPIFVDCLDDLTLDPIKLPTVMRNNVKAIIMVPIYGRPVSKKAYDFAKTNGLFIIEDMAEAHGIIPHGDISCYSFYGNKILTTGEGGMCLTNNKNWADEIRLYANMYFDAGRTMVHPKVGHNFRMTNVQAAIGFAQVEKCDEILEKRRQIVSWYDQYIPARYKMPKREVPWVYDIKIPEGESQEGVKQMLFDNGVDSRYFFKPMSEQPMYYDEPEKLNAYHWSRRGLYLPLYPDLTKQEVKHICECLKYQVHV
jgi:dTDP-4-amino-4,6-dideoxygalactose transaminase